MSLNARIQVHVIAATFSLSFIHFFSQNLLSIRKKKVNKTYSPWWDFKSGKIDT